VDPSNRKGPAFNERTAGNDEVIIMGNAETGRMRLIAEIDKKGRIAEREIPPKVS